MCVGLPVNMYTSTKASNKAWSVYCGLLHALYWNRHCQHMSSVPLLCIPYRYVYLIMGSHSDFSAVSDSSYAWAHKHMYIMRQHTSHVFVHMSPPTQHIHLLTHSILFPLLPLLLCRDLECLVCVGSTGTVPSDWNNSVLCGQPGSGQGHNNTPQRCAVLSTCVCTYIHTYVWTSFTISVAFLMMS